MYMLLLLLMRYYLNPKEIGTYARSLYSIYTTRREKRIVVTRRVRIFMQIHNFTNVIEKIGIFGRDLFHLLTLERLIVD